MKIKILHILLIVISTVLLIGEISYAQTSSNLNKEDRILLAGDNPFIEPVIPKSDLLPGPDEDRQRTEGGARSILVSTILPFFGITLIGIVGGMSLIFLVISGVRFATAYGNDEAVTKAKDQARYAVIGLVIAILSYTIVRIITNLQFTTATTPPPAPAPAGYIQTETHLIV